MSDAARRQLRPVCCCRVEAALPVDNEPRASTATIPMKIGWQNSQLRREPRMLLPSLGRFVRNRSIRTPDELNMTDPTLSKPVLYIFSGLPGSGKTTLAKMLAKALSATYLRIDTIEQALRKLCAIEVEGEGYRLAYRVAADNLQSGLNVVADSCNPINITREEWENVAAESGAAFVNIEVTCSDPVEHRGRIESRESSIMGLRLPSWQEVERREYDDWVAPRVVVDTAGRNEAECFDELLSRLRFRMH